MNLPTQGEGQKLLKKLLVNKERESKLRTVTRYSLYHTMFYRTDLWIHTRRVYWIVKELTPLVLKVFPEFNAERAELLALCHDDIEIVMGDIQAGNKSKMTPEQLAQVKQKEKESIGIIAKKFVHIFDPKFYEDLLWEANEKKTLETVIVDWADKYDAFGESLHEVYSGNKVFAQNVINEYGTIPLPTTYYVTYINKFKDKFPLSLELFKENNPLFSIPIEPAAVEIAEKAKQPTSTSLKKKSGYFPYDFWIATTFKYGTKEDISRLWEKREGGL